MSILRKADQQPQESTNGYEWIVPLSRGENQSLAQVVIVSGGGSPAHKHKVTEEVYHILSGKAIVIVDGIKEVLEVGDEIVITPGQVHQILNHLPGALEFLCTSSPPWSPDDYHLME